MIDIFSGGGVAKRYRRRTRRTRPWPTEEPVRPVPVKPRSRWRPGYWLRHPGLGIAFLVLMTPPVVGAGLDMLHKRNVIVERGERTVGTVLHVHRRSVTVAFTTQSGVPLTASVGRPLLNDPREWEEVEVVYDPVDPTGRAYLSGSEPGLLWPILCLGGGAVLGLTYGRWLRRKWDGLLRDARWWRMRYPVRRCGARR